MFKNWEMAVYFLAAFFCVFVDDLRLLLAIVLSDVLILLIVRISCRKLLENFDMDRYVRAKILLNAAETCFVLAAIFAGFSLVRMVFYMIFQPKYFFSGTLWLGYLIQILPALGLWIFFHRTSGALVEVEKKKSYIDSPPSEKLDDFYAFSNIPQEEEEEEKEEENDSREIPDVSLLFDDTVPDEKDFNRHMRQVSIINHVSEPTQLWECPFCGSLNTEGSEQCDFCGVAQQRKEDSDE